MPSTDADCATFPRRMYIKSNHRIALLLAAMILSCQASAHIPSQGGTLDFAPISDGGAAARNLEQLRNRLHPIAWLGRNVPASDPNVDSMYEVRATLTGRVGSGDTDLLLLQTNGINIDALVPHSYSPAWLGDCAPVRLIVRDNPQPDISNATYIVVAAAPESEVSALDAPGIKAKAAGSPRSRLASRFNFANSSELPTGHPVVWLPDNLLRAYPYYRDAIAHYNPRLDQITLDRITTSILVYSNHYQIDPRLIMSMIVAESGFNPQSTSRTGAMGLGQLMPGTAAGMGVANPYDPVENVGAAVKILSGHVNQYGGSTSDGLVPMNTLLLTMAAYNAGGGAVAKYHGVPPYRETQNYVHKVSELYRRMCGG